MKKIYLPCIIGAFLLSCNSDDDSDLDPIVGTWKITSSKVDGKEIHSTNDCDKDNSMTFFYDGKIKDNYSYINLQNECVNSEKFFEWENSGNSVYKIDDFEVKIIFSNDNNTFTETLTIKGLNNEDVTVAITRLKINL